MGVKNRRLSKAPFYVLARTKMPAILVEVAFITNPREERLLQSPAFRAQVAEGILAGLKSYNTQLSKK
jgi:N-acetylmuramoyl-L-alanine amidase